MIVDPNRMYLGSEKYNDDAVIYFVDGDLDVRTDKDDIDPEEDLDLLWAIDGRGGNLSFRDEQADEDILTVGGGEATFGEGLQLGGDMSDLNVVDDMIRLSGFSNTFEFRRSETDWDQMFEFRRQSNSDYEMYLHRDGSPEEVLTEDHDVDATTLGGNGPDDFILGGLEASNDGSLVHDSVYELNFGQDLGVTATTDGVTVDYVGATIPAVVYDNGNEILSDANGIDFQSGVNVTVGPDDVAQIDVGLATTVADTEDDEVIGGNWSFDEIINGTITDAEYATTAGYAEDLDASLLADFAEPDVDEQITGTWLYTSGLGLADGEELAFGDNDEFRQRYSAATDRYVFETDVAGVSSVIKDIDRSSEAVDFQFDLQQSGDSVATEAWVENEADTLGTDTENTFTATQHFEAGIDASDGDYIAFPAHDSEPNYSGWPDGAGWFQTDEV